MSRFEVQLAFVLGVALVLCSGMYGADSVEPLPPGAIARFGPGILRHHRTALGITFSPDGKCLASIGDDHTLCIWDPKTGKELRRIVVPEPYRCSYIAYAPDGRSIVCNGSGANVYLLDSTTGKEIRRFSTDDSLALHGPVAVSPDGKVLVANKGHYTVMRWDIATGERLQTFGPPASFQEFSPDGKLFAGANGDLYDSTTGKQVRQMLLEKDPRVRGSALSRDWSMLVTAHDSGSEPAQRTTTIRLWDISTGKEVRQWEAHRGRVYGVLFSPDGRQIVTSGHDGLVRIWDTRSGTEVRHITSGKGLWLRSSPDGRILAGMSFEDPAIRLWDPETGLSLPAADQREGFIAALAFAPDGKTVATAGESTIRLWRARSGEALGRLDGHGPGIQSLSFSPDGKLLASAGKDGTTRLWDWKVGREVQRFDDGGACVAFSPNGALLVSGARPPRLREVSSSKETARLRALEHEPHWLAFSSDGALLASGGGDPQNSVVFELPTGKRLFGLGGPSMAKLDVTSAQFSRDGSALVSVSSAELVDVQLLDRANRLTRRSTQVKLSARCLAISLEGNIWALGRRDGSIVMWDVAAWEPRHIFKAQHGAVVALSFSSDRKTLGSVHEDGTALLWNVPPWIRARNAVRFSEPQLQTIWRDLGTSDDLKAYRALSILPDAPEQVLAYFGERLRALSVRGLPQLILALETGDPSEREAALRAFEQFGELAIPALREALGRQPSAERRERFEQLLSQGKEGKGSPSSLSVAIDILAASRALQFLERMGSPRAWELLESLGRGVPEKWVTQEARIILEHSHGKPGVKGDLP